MSKVFFKNVGRGKDFSYAVKLFKKRGAEFDGSLWSIDSDKAESLRGCTGVQEVTAAPVGRMTEAEMYRDWSDNPNSVL